MPVFFEQNRETVPKTTPVEHSKHSNYSKLFDKLITLIKENYKGAKVASKKLSPLGGILTINLQGGLPEFDALETITFDFQKDTFEFTYFNNENIVYIVYKADISGDAEKCTYLTTSSLDITTGLEKDEFSKILEDKKLKKAFDSVKEHFESPADNSPQKEETPEEKPRKIVGCTIL